MYFSAFLKRKEGRIIIIIIIKKKAFFLFFQKRDAAHATIRIVPTAAKKYGGGLSELVAVAARVEREEKETTSMYMGEEGRRDE
jgi:hypothetical protein